MYLTELSVIKVLTELREHISHFSISFDYMAEEVVALSTGNQPTTSFVERFAQMGAPWRFGINDLEGLLEEAVMKVVRRCDNGAPLSNLLAAPTVGREYL